MIISNARVLEVRKKDENGLHVTETRMLRRIRGKTRKGQVRNQAIQKDAKVCQMSTNTPETEEIQLLWTYQEKRRRQPLKDYDGHGRTGEEKKGAA